MLAREAGVHVETVRYYEQRGLLKAPRRVGGWRRYDDEAVRVLRFVKRAQELGFTLDEVHELLSLRASNSADACSRVRALVEAKLGEVEKKLHRLEKIRETLRVHAAGCPPAGPPATCSLLALLDCCDEHADG